MHARVFIQWCNIDNDSADVTLVTSGRLCVASVADVYMSLWALSELCLCMVYVWPMCGLCLSLCVVCRLAITWWSMNVMLRWVVCVYSGLCLSLCVWSVCLSVYV